MCATFEAVFDDNMAIDEHRHGVMPTGGEMVFQGNPMHLAKLFCRGGESSVKPLVMVSVVHPSLQFLPAAFSISAILSWHV